MTDSSLDQIREGVLDRMERADRIVRWSILGGAAAEAALFVIAFLSLDWHDRVERTLFLFFLLGYSILVLGLIALAAHVTRVGARVLRAVDPSPGR